MTRQESKTVPEIRFTVLSIFPGIVSAGVGESILGRAIERGVLAVDAVDIRDFASGRHRVVDDYPYGGGPGMVMKPEPVFAAVESLALPPGVPLILLSPAGRRFDQGMARELAGHRRLVLICGRYEGIDERIREGLGAAEVSVGDYVLTGGEVPALVLIDAVSRLVPGVLGKGDSAEEETFSAGLLEYPQYTRPPEFAGMKVPEVLLSGDHARVARWRRERSLAKTLRERPDLLVEANLDEKDREFLKKGT
jgi:tRNA (guanine37-N1)-methyltransferase